MENNFIKERVSFLKDIGKSCVLHKVDEDCIIPDYNAEIMRVLNCKTTVFLSNKSLSGNKLTLDICAEYLIVYQSYDMNIYTYRYDTNYVKVVDVPEGLNENNFDVTLDATDSVCKATGKRKIEIKGSLKIEIREYDPTEIEFINSLSDDFEKNCEGFSANILEIFTEKQITLKEELTDNFSTSNIIDSFCKPRITDYRIVADKVVIKGEVECYAITLDENLSAQIKNYNFQFGQIIEAEGVSEDHKCVIDAYGLNCRFEENECLFTLKLICKCFKETNIEFVSDCFSVNNELECKYDEKCFSDYIMIDKKSERTNVSFGKISDEICEINYFNVSLKNCDAAILNGELCAKITAVCNFIGCDESKTCVGFEKTQEFDIKLQKVDCVDNANISANAIIKSIEKNEGSQELSFSIDLEIEYQICKTKSSNILNEVCILGEKEERKTRSAAITIYYADSGEKIFDIAKKYDTKMSLIMIENDLESERLYSKRHLLIPLI